MLQVVGRSLPSDQLLPFLDALQEALLDPQSHSSSGACVVLNSVVKSRGGELHAEVRTDTPDFTLRFSPPWIRDEENVRQNFNCAQISVSSKKKCTDCICRLRG